MNLCCQNNPSGYFSVNCPISLTNPVQNVSKSLLNQSWFVIINRSNLPISQIIMSQPEEIQNNLYYAKGLKSNILHEEIPNIREYSPVLIYKLKENNDDELENNLMDVELHLIPEKFSNNHDDFYNIIESTINHNNISIYCPNKEKHMLDLSNISEANFDLSNFNNDWFVRIGNQIWIIFKKNEISFNDLNNSFLLLNHNSNIISLSYVGIICSDFYNEINSVLSSLQSLLTFTIVNDKLKLLGLNFIPNDIYNNLILQYYCNNLIINLIMDFNLGFYLEPIDEINNNSTNNIISDYSYLQILNN